MSWGYWYHFQTTSVMQQLVLGGTVLSSCWKTEGGGNISPYFCCLRCLWYALDHIDSFINKDWKWTTLTFFFKLNVVWWIGEKSGIYLLLCEVALHETISEGGMDRSRKSFIPGVLFLDQNSSCVKTKIVCCCTRVTKSSVKLCGYFFKSFL